MLIMLEAHLKKIMIVKLLSILFILTGCATIKQKNIRNDYMQKEAQGCVASDTVGSIKVALEDCERISRLIKKAGVIDGFVGYDESGRIKLKGTYLNEEQVDVAFMIALTVVGASSMDISPITPRDLKEIKMVKSYTLTDRLYERKGDKYALLVGVSKFKNHIGSKLNIGPIQTAVNDVESIAEKLKRNGFKKENIRSLKDEDATKNNILKAMRDLESKAKPNDSVVFYISTHGTPPDTFGKMGVIPYDMEAKILDNRTETVQELANKIPKDDSGDEKIIEIVKDRIASLKTAISFDDIQDFITSIKTDKFIAIFDTCYSGSALGALTYPVGGMQYAEREKNYSQSLNVENKSELLGGGKMCELSSYNSYAQSGITIKQSIETNQKICQNNSGKGIYFDPGAPLETIWMDKDKYEYEMLETFRTAFSGTQFQQGKAIITATSGNEQSLFKPALFPNSYFTYYLVRGIERFNGQIFPAFDYAQLRTRKLVSDTESCRTQTPEMVSVPYACINIDLSK
ncbi:MAG: caspase family protein [Methylovulum sp.]|nr:caspase family protein [Methylovulum sp.]